jgi:copper homeostasis protein
MHKLLEVIVTSAEEAVIAAAGGADRLELVRELDTGGLTPSWEDARAVTESVSIPVRVMLRENASMSVAGAEELRALRRMAARFQQLRIDGLVMGWIGETGELDLAALEAILPATPICKVTFHRAFEHLADPRDGLRVLKSFKQVDRILTGGGPGPWEERKRRLRELRDAAAPEIGVIVGGGLSDAEIAELLADAEFPEVHVGRAARNPQENDGALDAGKMALLKILKSRRGR